MAPADSASTKASGSGGSGAGGTRSENGGAGGIGAGAGGGGCQTEGAACGKNKLCCSELSCGPAGTCMADSATSSSTGMTPCSTCNDALMGMSDGMLCNASKTKLTALQGCVCDPSGCEQPCSQFCGPQGGALGPMCQGCADTLCGGLYTNCRNDNGCFMCAGMLNNGDIDPNDACSGTAQDDFNQFFDCVCHQGPGCNGCSDFCSGNGFSNACKSCVGTMSNACFMLYKACAGN